MLFMSLALLSVSTSPTVDESQLTPDKHAIPYESPAQPGALDSAKKKALKHETAFEPFTGKVTGSKVRLRLQPNLDGIILKELSLGELLVVTGEFDEYYAVKPDDKYKGYLYRAYVLDNVVEANNVNLRLEPDTGAPILTQLGQGDSVQGTVCPENNKWLVIDLPETVRFYVAKDYVLRLGDAGLYSRIETRRQDVTKRLTELDLAITQELQKSFPAIQLVPYINELQTIVAQNEDLSTLTAQAQTLIKTAQEQYLARSQTFVESNQIAQSTPPQEAVESPPLPAESKPQPHYASFALEQQESSIVENAIQSGKASSREMFYSGEVRIAQELIGQIVPYDRLVKSRPGDFVLVEAKTKVPVAYLYSCHIDLESYVGQTVRVLVSSRPNHQFALPAYVVHEVKRW